MDSNSQYLRQRKYFGREFSRLGSYRLAAWQKTYLRRIYRTMLFSIHNPSKYTVLDIATGSGYVAVELAKLGYQVLACDLTPEAVQKLNLWKKELGLKNLRVFQSRAERIRLPDSSIDFIVANAILEHIPDETTAINEWKRLLKKRGKLFITVPLKFRYLWPFLWPVNKWYDRRIGHLRRYDLADLEQKFTLRSQYVAYTGHLAKIFGAILPSFLKHPFLEEKIESLDTAQEKTRFGASNIIAVLARC